MTSDSELSLRAQAAITQAEQNLTSWQLAQFLGEDEATVDRLGYKVYDQLTELDVHHLARVVVELLAEHGHYVRDAERILAAASSDELDHLMATTCPVCGKPMGPQYAECEGCWLAAETAYERGQDR